MFKKSAMKIVASAAIAAIIAGSVGTQFGVFDRGAAKASSQATTEEQCNFVGAAVGEAYAVTDAALAQGLNSAQTAWAHRWREVTLIALAHCLAQTSTTTTSQPTTTSTTVAPTTTTTSPPSTGFPDASNTGPSGTLAPSGSITTSAHGQVIENLDITGSVIVQHNNVVIRNVRIRSAGQAISVNNGQATNSTSGLVVEDCEIDGTGATDGASAIGDANYTIRRCEIHHIGEGPRSNGNVVVEDNYMHSFLNFVSQGAHQDGVQATSGDHHVIRHNNINIGNVDGANAAVFFGSYPGSDVLIENNLLSGGSYTVAVHNYSNVRVLNNQFKIAFNPANNGQPSSGWFGALLLENAPGTSSGNVWYDGPNAGQPI